MIDWHLTYVERSNKDIHLISGKGCRSQNYAMAHYVVTASVLYFVCMKAAAALVMLVTSFAIFLMQFVAEDILPCHDACNLEWGLDIISAYTTHQRVALCTPHSHGKIVA